MESIIRNISGRLASRTGFGLAISACSKRSQRRFFQSTSRHHLNYDTAIDTTPRALLDYLRTKTTVDCDTLDASVASSLGPFSDCTSNQAIAFFELSSGKHTDLLKQASSHSSKWLGDFDEDGLCEEALTVEIASVLLGLRMLPHLSGMQHIQLNPFDAYSVPRTVAGAERIVSLFQRLSNGAVDSSRVCIKIPSTWEGLQACRVLEKDRGISTLATTLFCMPQAMLAGEAGCRYIAPYVNELRVHFDPSYKDDRPNRSLCLLAQTYYEKRGLETMTLPASLVSVEECLALAGVKHITISPPLLQQLAKSEMPADVETKYPSIFQQAQENEIAVPHQRNFMEDEAGWRIAVTLQDSGEQERKLTQAINIFAEMQLKLEVLVRQF